MKNPSSSSSTTKAAPRTGSTTASKTTPCCTKVGLKRGPWTPEEDDLLTNYIKREGEGQWRTLPKKAGLLRCGKSCRLRWMNYLRPSVKRGHITPDEEDLILRLHRLLGNRWSLIAGRIPGRTDNEIKNYWNTHLSKKLISQGIDPRTHKPLNPNSSIDNKVSSSKANQNLVFNVDYASFEDTLHVGGNGTNLDPYQSNYETAADADVNMGTVDGSKMVDGLSSEEDDDINICSDAVFSSFLDSLINEDVYNSQAQHPNMVGPNSDSLVSATTPAHDQNNLSSLKEHV